MARSGELYGLVLEEGAGPPCADLQSEAEPAPAGARRLVSARRLAAPLLAAAAACALAAAWHGRAAGGARLEGAPALLGFSESGAGRSCITFPGVRLADGGKPLKGVEGNTTSDDCAKLCQEDADCAQVVYSSSNEGCYPFGTATEVLSTDKEPSSGYTSVYCGSGQGLADLRQKEQIVWSEAKKRSHADVQSQWDEAERRALELLDGKELESKVQLLMGSEGGMGYAGFLKLDEALEGALNVQMNDGPQGFNTYQDALAGTSTQLPCLLALAASFNPSTAWKYANVVGEEFVEKGSNNLLGPDIEVERAPRTGRSFETISGEDPYLGSQLVGPYVQAVQAKGVMSTVKHWLDNNQEIYRMTMTSEVSDRANQEIYMPPFKAAIEAGAVSVMCAYNKVHESHACENKKLLTELLRKDLGFRGFVVSDWGATHDAVKSVEAGLDVEMPAGGTFTNLTKLVQEGQLSEDQIDNMAGNVLAAMYFTGQFDGRFPEDKNIPLGHAPAASEEHRQVALETIIDGAVLLKNEGSVLPLGDAGGKKIALIGKYCSKVFEADYAQGSVYAGGGSGFVNTTQTVSILDGVKDVFGEGSDVTYSTDASAGEGADVAVVCAAAHAEEGWDREDSLLPEAEALVKSLRKQDGHKKIVVIAILPGVVTTEWVADADAVMVLFMPGEQVGVAVAQMLSGEAAPAGRLPVSFPAKDEERFTNDQYPGVCPAPDTWCDKMVANFSEGTLVGYRWNDATGKPSAYPFGFGLAYTEFEYRAFEASCQNGRAIVSVKISNAGGRSGTEVPQLYVSFESLKPVLRQLRGFQKVEVPAGGEADVFFVLGEEDWSFYDEAKGRWVSAVDLEEKVTVFVGRSSADLRLNGTLPCAASADIVETN
jgi:beta-glucosidase